MVRNTEPIWKLRNSSMTRYSDAKDYSPEQAQEYYTKSVLP